MNKLKLYNKTTKVVNIKLILNVHKWVYNIGQIQEPIIILKYPLMFYIIKLELLQRIVS